MMSCKGEMNKVAHLDKSAPKNRQRKQSEREEPAKRQCTSKVQRSNVASCEQQNLSATEKVRPTTSQPKGRDRSREVEEPFVDVSLEGQIDNTQKAVEYWLQKQTWPKEYFESDPMDPPLKGQESTPPDSEQRPLDTTSVSYQHPKYKEALSINRIFMEVDKEGPRIDSISLCLSLLAQNQDVPQTSRFSESIFESTCSSIQGRNEAKVTQDIARLIVPSVEELADFGAENLKCLVESVSERWHGCVPVTKTRPEPDYSAGFKRIAFSEEQLKKLTTWIPDFTCGEQSSYMATWYMYFPFLTCEVKCGARTLDEADRQNAHSTALAVSAVVKLFQLVKREKEINREILAFSVSHDDNIVRMYGHYAVVDESNNITIYRYRIRHFSFQEMGEKWTSYKFVKSVYNTWMPIHLERLRSAIDDLPSGVNFDVPPL